MGVAFSGKTALAAFCPELADRGGVMLAVSLLSVLFRPATEDVGASFGAAPTSKPGGAPLASLALPTPLPLACASSVPKPDGPFPRTSGIPAASGFPCGPAENMPRRLPAGIAAAAFGGAGWTLRAMTCPPPVRELPSPFIEGGGAATVGPPPLGAA